MIGGPTSFPRLHLPLPAHWRLACFGTSSGIIIATIACFGTCSSTSTYIGCSTASRHGDATVVDACAGSGFCMRGAWGTGMGLWAGWGVGLGKEGSEGKGGWGVSLGR